MNRFPFRRSLGLVAAAVAIGAMACSRTAPDARGPHLLERTKPAMGTELHLFAFVEDEKRALAAFDEVFKEFDRLENLMSIWRDGSDVQRLNAAAGDHPVPVSEEVRDVLRTAKQVSEWTGGRFDVTFGVLSDLWKFDTQDKDNTVPDPEEIRKRLPLINFRELDIDEVAGTAFLKRKGMRVNLGGIGKG